MKLLVDTCVAESVCQELLGAGHDVEYVGDWEGDPGDWEIQQFANREGRVIITLDRHFGELAASTNISLHGVVRLRNHRIQDQGHGCIEALQMYGEELQKGAIVVVQPGKIRCSIPKHKPTPRRP